MRRERYIIIALLFSFLLAPVVGIVFTVITAVMYQNLFGLTMNKEQIDTIVSAIAFIYIIVIVFTIMTYYDELWSVRSDGRLG